MTERNDRRPRPKRLVRPAPSQISMGADWRAENSVGDQSRAISAAKRAEYRKMVQLYNSNGPHSIGEGHYPKSYFLKPREQS